MNQDQLRDQVAEAIVQYGAGQFVSSINGKTGVDVEAAARAVVREVVAPLLADLEAKLTGAQLDILERGKKIDRLSLIAATHLFDGEILSEREAIRTELIVQFSEENARLRREVEFWANGADTFSGADELAEGGSQCSVHPDRDVREVGHG